MVKQPDNIRHELKQLWGEFLPPLTPEQVELSVQLWQKIQVRQRQSKQNNSSSLS